MRRGRLVAILATAGLAVAGLAVLAVAFAGQRHPAAPARSAAGVVAPGGTRLPASGHPRPVTALVPPAPPTAIDVPAIRVRSTLLRLGRNPDGSVQVPGSYQVAGWYDESATPGESGPMVILGHVDSTRGPGVFFSLGTLRPGDMVKVRRTDGRVVTYVITGVREYPKDRFPSLAVYGPTLTPTIRLITCGGAFDSTSGHYVDNVVAFGQLAA